MNNAPVQTEIKYLGITLDKRLTWGPHLKEKRKSANSRLRLLRQFVNSKIPLQNKLIIYKSIIRPVWSYGIAIWGPAKPSNIRPIQVFQSIALRLVTKAPWYVSNCTLHQGLEPNPKEPVLKPVLGGFSRTGTDIGTYISYFKEPESEPEPFDIYKKKFGLFTQIHHLYKLLLYNIIYYYEYFECT